MNHNLRIYSLFQWPAFIPLALAATGLVAAEESAKPNVILIMADDIAYDNVGCYGSEHFKTPRLDELARTGIKFNHCYSEPVCTSSRVKIMTGRDNIRNYTVFGKLDPKEKTFGTMMKDAGYATGIAGKWQLHGNNGALAPDCGFDTFCLWNYPGTERQRFWNPSLIRDGKLVPVTEDSYGPDICTDFLIEFIQKNKDCPFFAYYPMLSVHSPFLPTPDSADRNNKSKDENYRDMVSYMDKCVGRLVDALEKNGLRENTIVIFTTDNGTGRSLKYPYKGEMRDGEKAYPTDGGCHAPLIVNCPGRVTSGEETDDIVDFSDVMPTLAEIGSATLPDVTLDGRSFWPQCIGKTGNPREWIFQYYYPKFKDAAMKHGAGKPYIIWSQDQHYKLYSHGKFIQVKDRHERTNISPGTGTPEAEAARKKLQAAIDSMPKKVEKKDGELEDPKTLSETERLANFVAALESPVASQPSLKAGTNEFQLEDDGHQREVLVRLPDDYDPAKRYAVVFGFHGAGGPKEAYHRHLESLVKEHGMISVSPQGLSNALGKTAWNGFANHRLSNADDVGFVARTIDYLAANASIDRDRIFATGGSSGAIFCFRLAMETDLFAAIAPMRGAMIKRPPVPKGRPKLSILLACGTEDGLFTGNTKVPTEVFYPAQETMALWAANHGADGSAPTTLEDLDVLALTRYSTADAPYELLLHAVKGRGHKLERPELEEAIRFMGDFFSRHSKADTRERR